jgi:hypothetical protein
MSAIAEVKIMRDGKIAVKRVQLLGGNVEQDCFVGYHLLAMTTRFPQST